jgi:hypothetical protein
MNSVNVILALSTSPCASVASVAFAGATIATLTAIKKMTIIATFAKLDILPLLLIECLLWILSEMPMISLKYLHYQYINLTMRSRAVSWQLNAKVDIFQEAGRRGHNPDDRQDGSVTIGTARTLRNELVKYCSK